MARRRGPARARSAAGLDSNWRIWSAPMARRINGRTPCPAINAAPCATLLIAVPPRSVAIAQPVPPAALSASPTTPAATGTAPSASAWPRERWLAARRKELLPVEYFHVVFTLPHALNPLAQHIPGSSTACCSRPPLTPSSASAAIRAIWARRRRHRDPAHLGAEPFPAPPPALHRHRRRPGPDGAALDPRPPRLPLPRAGPLPVFRGTYLATLQRAVDRGDLPLTATLPPLADAAAFRAWLTDLRRQAWVVYCTPPFAGPAHVLAYLGRYTHRVAICNDACSPSSRVASASAGATTPMPIGSR